MAEMDVWETLVMVEIVACGGLLLWVLSWAILDAPRTRRHNTCMNRRDLAESVYGRDGAGPALNECDEAHIGDECPLCYPAPSETWTRSEDARK